ncbi:hypothetical protein PanWU01x14_082120 [Parasponia andersonii]|uniref:Retrotransposon gag domain-containing protein n=1 Tax=Parasponia andersonii TaxID=3476 RepID=A0A2P5DAH3_PARAD|nr:hypothetical protein PanWU01x14_082120 [Parasponia andersonii]
MCLSDADRTHRKMNPELLLFSWLLSSMTVSIVGCETSPQVWQALDTYFASQTKARIDQFKTQLQNTKKQSLSVNDYLLKIKSLVDQLGSVGHVILSNGLPVEYDTFVISVNSRSDTYTVAKIESFLLAQ